MTPFRPATTSPSPSRTPASAFRPTLSATCSIRSSPPSRSARGPGLGFRRCMGSCTRPAAPSRSPASSGRARRSPWCCRAHRASRSAQKTASRCGAAANRHGAPGRGQSRGRQRERGLAGTARIFGPMGAECGSRTAGDREGRHRLRFQRIVMPGRLDGLGLARIIKQKHPDMPILLATGYSEAAQNVRLDFPILRKPYQMHELSRALAELTRDCRLRRCSARRCQRQHR